ncbi:hypothetical protein D3C87_1744580 [compost metagenome]
MDFLFADLAAGDVQLSRDPLGHGEYLWRVLTVTAFISVEAARVLLAVAAQRIQLIGDLAVARVVGDQHAA